MRSPSDIPPAPEGPGRSARRPSALAGGLACLLALAGCDLFSTREFSRKPEAIHPLAAAFDAEDSAVFRITESLADPGASAAPTVLARKRLRFRRAPDASQPGGGWTAVAVRVTEEPSGALLEEGLVHIRSDEAGMALAPDADASSGSLGGGARYHSLKMAASAVRTVSAEGPDSAVFLALPPAFSPGRAWLQSLGILEVARTLESVDTLTYRGRLEESWRVSETVLEGSRPLSRGTSWYGASGLIRAEQTWVLEARDGDGALEGSRELRRELARL